MINDHVRNFYEFIETSKLASELASFGNLDFGNLFGHFINIPSLSRIYIDHCQLKVLLFIWTERIEVVWVYACHNKCEIKSKVNFKKKKKSDWQQWQTLLGCFRQRLQIHYIVFIRLMRCVLTFFHSDDDVPFLSIIIQYSILCSRDSKCCSIHSLNAWELNKFKSTSKPSYGFSVYLEYG